MNSRQRYPRNDGQNDRKLAPIPTSLQRVRAPYLCGVPREERSTRAQLTQSTQHNGGHNIRATSVVILWWHAESYALFSGQEEGWPRHSYQ